MLNFIGAGLVTLGGCVVGYFWSNHLVTRHELLKDYRKSLGFIQLEIDGLNSPIIDACRNAGEKTGGKVGKLLLTFSDEFIKQINSSKPEEVWDSVFKAQNFSLRPCDIKMFSNLPKCVGAVDKVSQLATLQMISNELDVLLGEVYTENATRVPMAWKLSLIAGATVALCIL